MSNPRFSVVIPTRQRADTLLYTLRTCLAQRFDNYEIVVCDNCSSPATKQTVESFKSSKIKYIRSDRPLAMSDNWELAVSHAAGEYVIVIGDDDGLLPYALEELNYLLQTTRAKALRWEYISYFWPDIALPKLANKLDIPLVRGNRVLRSLEVIPSVANLRMTWQVLPMLYNSAIHRDLIAMLRKKTSRVFSERHPDIYSGFAFAYLVKSYPSIGRPMSIGAASAKSTGVATVYLGEPSEVSSEFCSLNRDADLGCHPQVPNIEVVPAFTASAFQHAKQALFPNDRRLRIDRRRLIENCVHAIVADSEAQWKQDLQAIRVSLEDDASLGNWFDSKFRDYRPPLRSEKYSFEWEEGFDGTNLHINAARFGVKDVFGAAELCEKILGSGSGSSRWVKTSVLQKIFRRLYDLTPNSWREYLLQSIRALI